MKRALVIGVALAAALAIAAGLLVWSPWAERTFAAEDVPTSCEQLADLREELVPGAPAGKEQTYWKAGGSVAKAGTGSTLLCTWANDTLVLELNLEHWTDGPEAAEAGFAEVLAGYKKPVRVDIGDEAVFSDSDIASIGHVRIGNIIVQVLPGSLQEGVINAELLTRILQAVVERLTG